MEDRHAAYRALIRERLDPAFVEALRAGTNGSWALGRERFRKEAAAERRAAPLPPGPKPARQMNSCDPSSYSDPNLPALPQVLVSHH